MYYINIWEKLFRKLLRWIDVVRLIKSKLKQDKNIKLKIELWNTDFSLKCLGSHLFMFLYQEIYIPALIFWEQIFSKSSRTGGLTGNNHWKIWLFRFHFGSSDISNESMDSYDLQDLFSRKLFLKVLAEHFSKTITTQKKNSQATLCFHLFSQKNIPHNTMLPF